MLGRGARYSLKGARRAGRPRGRPLVGQRREASAEASGGPRTGACLESSCRPQGAAPLVPPAAQGWCLSPRIFTAGFTGCLVISGSKLLLYKRR